MQKMIPALTDRQRYWLEHIQACEASGKSIAEYATEHGVNVRAMYSGKKILVNKGVLPATQPPRFQRVQVMEATLSSQWFPGERILVNTSADDVLVNWSEIGLSAHMLPSNTGG